MTDRPEITAEEAQLHIPTTKAILRRWADTAAALGYVPASLQDLTPIGRCTYTAPSSFEDRVNFVIDVAASLDVIDEPARVMLMLHVIAGHTQDALARRQGCHCRTLRKAVAHYLTVLTIEFYARGLIRPLGHPRHRSHEQFRKPTAASRVRIAHRCGLST